MSFKHWLAVYFILVPVSVCHFLWMAIKKARLLHRAASEQTKDKLFFLRIWRSVCRVPVIHGQPIKQVPDQFK